MVEALERGLRVVDDEVESVSDEEDQGDGEGQVIDLTVLEADSEAGNGTGT